MSYNPLVCYWCLIRPATTWDHTPPDSMIPNVPNKPKVPSCDACGGNRTKDDEFFSLLLSSAGEHEISFNRSEVVARGLCRNNNSLLKKTGAKDMWFFYRGLWKKTIIFTKPDERRLCKTVSYYVSGMHYNRTNNRIAIDSVIDVSVFTIYSKATEIQYEHRLIAKGYPAYGEKQKPDFEMNLGNEAILYNCTKEADCLYWMLSVYHSTFFLGKIAS